jgi:F0F1-type ATP synthase membrane subunit b/b'
LARLFDPKQKSFVRVVLINFLIFYLFCFVAKWQKLAPILFYLKNDDINGDVRDAPPPLFPRI